MGLLSPGVSADKWPVRDFRQAGSKAWAAFAGPAGWRAIGWPAGFAALALVLLVFDHVQDRIDHVVFWLCVGLIACVFAWLVEAARRNYRDLTAEQRRAMTDRVTGLSNGGALLGDLAALGATPRERRLLIVIELDGLRSYYDRVGDRVGDEFVERAARRMLEAAIPVGGLAYRIEPARFAVLAPADGPLTGESLLAVATASEDQEDDLLICRSYGEALFPDEASDPELILQLAGQRVTGFKQRQQRSARRQAHAVLMAVLDARRPDLRRHLRDVAFRAISVGRRLGLDGDAIDDVFLAAELQDIGLLTVPESVLDKDASLSAAEASLIRAHPVAGERIIASAPGLAPVAKIIRSVSERFDGSGSPDGLVGEQIPLGSRIIAVCVAFAAMTSPRPYRPTLSNEEALAELRRCAGSQFDPAVVEALAVELADELAEVPVPA
jgi:two-component system cell cycle response regulator